MNSTGGEDSYGGVRMGVEEEMDDWDDLFQKMDGKVYRLIGEAKKRDLDLVALRVSPAAYDVMRRSSHLMDWTETQKERTWRGLKIIIEAMPLPFDQDEWRSEIKLCVEAKQNGEHGRHFYFDADTSTFPRLALG